MNYNMEKLEEALQWLYAQKKTKKRENLERIHKCIELLHIQTPYQIIHIAGTNGKGSTASYLHTMLCALGKKVGLFVSPFVIQFNERIEVNGQYIKDEEIISYLDILRKFQEQYQEEYQDTIPFFELTLLMALLHFQKNEIDILVLECGLGGLLDATNILDKDVAVITNIGYDHMAQLGNTLEEIAFHKLGITKPGIPCFTAVDAQLKPYFLKYAKEHSVPLYFIQEDVSDIKMLPQGICFKYKNENFETSLSGAYQAFNASLAIAVIRYLIPQYPLELLEKSLKEVKWPARFEIFHSQIILDGAHNLPGIEALVRSLQAKYKEKRIKIVFTALKDKAIEDMLACLDTISDFYYFTTISDLRASTSSSFHTSKPYIIIEDYALAIRKALAELKSDEILVITGSLHFMSEVRRLLLGDVKNEL